MNPRDLNFGLFFLLTIWLFLIPKFDWNQIQLNRVLGVSFIASVISSIFVRYVSDVENYSRGLNYFRDYQRFQFGLSVSHAISGLFMMLSLVLLILGLKARHKNTREITRPATKTIILISFGLLIFISFGLLIFLPILSGLILILIVVLSAISWTVIPTVAIGINFVLMSWKSSGLVRKQQILIYLVIFFYALMPAWYPRLLDNKYRLGFNSGFAEAVEKNVDIASIHSWMAGQSCSEFEAYKGDKVYSALPDFIQTLNPSDVSFIAGCEDMEISQLVLGYPSSWIDPFGLAIFYPPTNPEQLLNSEKLISKNYEILPKSDDCSCYLYSPDK